MLHTRSDRGAPTVSRERFPRCAVFRSYSVGNCFFFMSVKAAGDGGSWLPEP